MIRTILSAWDVGTGWLATAFWSGLTYSRLRLRGAQVGTGLRVRGAIDLHLGRRAIMRIGPRCRFKSGFAENAVGGYRRLGIWVFNDGNLTIGAGVGISGSTIVCAREIIIEDEVNIGGGCNIYDTDFHSTVPEARLAQPDTDVRSKPIVIRRRSFVGGHSLILKGVTIGEAAVIGAGSVVTNDVPAGEIWAGNPARPVGKVNRERA